MKNLTIKVKLLSSFTVLAIIIAVVGYLGYHGMTVIADGQDLLYQQKIKSQYLMTINACQLEVKA